MEEIKVGEYVRTFNGLIGKVVQLTDSGNYAIRIYNGAEYVVRAVIAKHSKNIIDLIEVRDIVNNGYIYEIGNTEDGQKWVHNLNGLLLFENDIKTILTHEQYNANCYKVKGE